MKRVQINAPGGAGDDGHHYQASAQPQAEEPHYVNKFDQRPFSFDMQAGADYRPLTPRRFTNLVADHSPRQHRYSEVPAYSRRNDDENWPNKVQQTNNWVQESNPRHGLPEKQTFTEKPAFQDKPSYPEKPAFADTRPKSTL